MKFLVVHHPNQQFQILRVRIRAKLG